RARTSGENLFVVLLVMAPSSQELEPPANPGRFSHAKNMTNAMKARLTEAATTAQQRIVAGENSRGEVSTQSGGIQVSSKDPG
ncbi:MULTISPECIES: hypothetical protein, partial [unclassified Bradyrhizobium]|uniref:hypothetical protein n=1 Tax=unclassified Bradyrhizobium TaxID=2631580 RepID=UPI001FF91B3C